jgi:hypothetical protein
MIDVMVIHSSCILYLVSRIKSRIRTTVTASHEQLTQLQTSSLLTRSMVIHLVRVACCITNNSESHAQTLS